MYNTQTPRDLFLHSFPLQINSRHTTFLYIGLVLLPIQRECNIKQFPLLENDVSSSKESELRGAVVLALVDAKEFDNEKNSSSPIVRSDWV